MSHFHRSTKNRFTTPQKRSNPDPTISKNLQKKTPPTIQPKTIYTDQGGKVTFSVEHTISRRKNTPYLDMSTVELQEIVQDYDYRIGILKDYLQQNDQIQKLRIAEIFGFAVHSQKSNGDDKVVLKELSTKVKELIQQNNKLKSDSKYQLQHNAELLLKENKKLQMILEEFKNSENRTQDRLISENNQLKNQIIILSQRLQQSQKELKAQPIKQSVIYRQAPPVLVQNNAEIQQAEHRLVSYINSQSEKFNQINITHLNKIANLEGRLEKAERMIGQYQKQRQRSVQSTIRKSLALSLALNRPLGDDENDVPEPEEIGSSNNMTFGKPVSSSMHISNQPQVNSPQMMHMTSPPQNLAREREMEQKIAILEEKNRHMSIEMMNLQRYLQESEQRGAQKVEKIIQLEKEVNMVSSTMKVSQTEKKDEDFEKEVKNIRQTLIFCNPNNFQQFFNEFNEIIRQRNQMRLHLEEIKTIDRFQNEESMKKNQQARQFLEEKVRALTQQNQNLIKKITKLEEEMENYQAELITSQIDKLKSFQINASTIPTGQEAINWQKTVKSCIQEAVQKLQVLENRMAQKKRFIKVTH